MAHYALCKILSLEYEGVSPKMLEEIRLNHLSDISIWDLRKKNSLTFLPDAWEPCVKLNTELCLLALSIIMIVHKYMTIHLQKGSLGKKKKNENFIFFKNVFESPTLGYAKILIEVNSTK